MDFLIIGGDAAGMSAASRAKRNRPDMNVTVLEKTTDVSYSACGMPYNIADVHMKRQIMGREVLAAITEGRLDFGPWEQIFYGEFDGKRKKRVLVKIIGE